MANASSAALSVRVSPGERVLLEAAPRNARANLSDFVRRKAVEAAEADLIERRIVTIPAEDRDRFAAWVDSPARDISESRKLAASRPEWQD